VDCTVKSLWQVVQEAVNRVVDQMTLADLISSEMSANNVSFFSQPARPPAGLLN
jgi:DNA-binding IscR family transcriptional regulator